MKNIHFIGIGGIGMSSLAYILALKGNKISGSDITSNNLTKRLGKMGAKIYRGHSKKNIIRGTNLVVRSSCIGNDNPEMVGAKELNIEILSRSELLKNVLEEFSSSIGVTGTHGKTTTSSLISFIMEKAGKDPTVILGGEIPIFKGNAKLGLSEMVISEVDESDGYFGNIKVKCGVITNIEREHIENYGSMRNLLGSYKKFASNLSKDGLLVYNGDDGQIKKLLPYNRSAHISFGLTNNLTYSCANLQTSKGINFDLLYKGKKITSMESPLIGRHNTMNILAAISVAMEFGVPLKKIKKYIKLFDKVKRRFELRGTINSIEIFEDYAHHPTELMSVIRSAKEYTKGRVISVFQPHRYSRTSDLANDFCKSFYDSDILVFTNTYSASEKPVDITAVKKIYEKIDKKRFYLTRFLEKDDIPAFISKIAQNKDTVLILGAGDIIDITPGIIKLLKKR